MQSLIVSLKTGDWVTAQRMRVYSLTLLAFWFCAIATVIITSTGGLDFMGRPLGTDFSNVWSAGRMVLDGRAQGVYDPSLHYLVQQAAFQARDVVLESGALSWDKLVSVFAALRLLGVSVPVAYGAQGVMALIAAISIVWLWRQPVARALKSAGLVTAALLVSPYALDYDLVVLGLGIAWMAAHGLKHGFIAWEKSALVLVWTTPLVCRIFAHGLHLPLGLIVLVLFLALIMRRARYDLASAIDS